MAEIGVRSTTIDPGSLVDELIGNRTADGLVATLRVPIADFERQLMATGAVHDANEARKAETALIPTLQASISATQARMDIVEAGQEAGAIGAATEAALNALAATLGLGAGDAGKLGKVFNDPNQARNGDYTWSGSTFVFQKGVAPVSALVEGVSIDNEAGALIPSGEYLASAYLTVSASLTRLFVELRRGEGSIDVSVLHNGVTVSGPHTVDAAEPLLLTDLDVDIALGDSLSFVIEDADDAFGLWAQISGVITP